MADIKDIEDALKTSDIEEFGEKERLKLKAKRKINQSDSPKPNGIEAPSIKNEQILNLHSYLYSLPDLDAENTEIKKYLECYREIFKEVFIMIQNENLKIYKKDEEIKNLNYELSELKCQICTMKEWQNTVYSELQKATTIYQNYIQDSNFNDTKEQNKSSHSTSTQDENIVKISKCSNPVFYGDSSVSKKLKDRKKLKLITGQSAGELKDVTKQNNNMDCNEKVDIEFMNNVEAEVKTDQSNEISIEKKSLNSCTMEEISDDISNTGVNEQSIEETLKEAAESVISKSGFVYDELSGLYYDWNLKMYYDPSVKLYYDHQNGIYYYYDTEKQTYIFHSQIEIPAQKSTDDSTSQQNEQLSDGEIEFDLSENENVSVDPCVRAIVVSSDILDEGNLSIITVDGGTIGSNSNCQIQINDSSISPIHAEIIYDKEDKTFFIENKDSNTGVYINNEKLEKNDSEMKEPVEIAHRDIVKIGETSFAFHVHLGHETCSDCEPGIIKSKLSNEIYLNDIEILSKEEQRKQHKLEIKKMKKRLGITPGYNPSEKMILSIPDRAQKRRDEVGSAPYANTEEPVVKASVHKEIPDTNKGHKMLAKMGWKSGEGLGKSRTGITAPVTVNFHEKNKGLGSGTKKSISSDRTSRKQDNWDKARERYQKLD